MPLCDGGHRTTMFMGFLRARTTSPPDVLKRLRRHRRITHGVGDAGVPEVVLQSASVHALAARAKPVLWRSMWTWIAKGSFAISPALLIILPMPMRPNGCPRSFTNT